MGYPVAYNTAGAVSGSLDRGNINVFISSSITSTFQGKTFGPALDVPANGMLIIGDNGSTPLFWAINDLTDADSVLDTINRLPDRMGQTPFTDTGSALAYLGTSGDYFALDSNKPLPQIVTDGLSLYLDAGQLMSYPTTGSSWYDLSGQDNNGTLINGPTFSSGSGGSIVFDGVDDTISVPDNAVLDFTGSVNLTSEVWINLNLYKDISIVNAKGNGGGVINAYNYLFVGTNVSFYFRFSDGTTTQNSPFIGKSNLPEGTWGHVVGVLDTTAIRLYLNGVEIGTATTRTINPKANNDSFLISSPSYSLNGKIAISRIYNRALSASEVLQNFNAQKSRFGL